MIIENDLMDRLRFLANRALSPRPARIELAPHINPRKIYCEVYYRDAVSPAETHPVFSFPFFVTGGFKGELTAAIKGGAICAESPSAGADEDENKKSAT